MLTGETVLRGERSIHLRAGLGMMAIGGFVILAALAAAGGGGARPAVALGLFGSLPLLAGFATLTAAVVVDDAAIRWRSLFLQRRSIPRPNFQHAELYRCRPGRGAGPQWGIRIWQVDGGNRLLPLRWAYTTSNQAMLTDLCQWLNTWRVPPAPPYPPSPT